MKFTKMHGAGNDFIIIDNISEKYEMSTYGELAKVLCERRFSIGADGLIVIDKATKNGDFMMRYYNSDGSIGEMCGNGARCIARYGYENGLSGEKQTIETASGTVYGKRITQEIYQIRLNDVTKLESNLSIKIENVVYSATYVELGTPGLPHLVVPIDNLKTIDWQTLKPIAQKMRYYADFPKGANINFYESSIQNHLFELTYERGVEDYTYACGTGTASVVAALAKSGKVTGKNVSVDMMGGTLTIDLDIQGDRIFNILLSGPTKLVASGEIKNLQGEKNE